MKGSVCFKSIQLEVNKFSFTFTIQKIKFLLNVANSINNLQILFILQVLSITYQYVILENSLTENVLHHGIIHHVWLPGGF